jgi:hypothetical protein
MQYHVPEIRGEDYISYYVYDFLLDGIIAKGLNVQSTLPKLLQLIDPRVMLPPTISNLTRMLSKLSKTSLQFSSTENKIHHKVQNFLYRISQINKKYSSVNYFSHIITALK